MAKRNKRFFQKQFTRDQHGLTELVRTRMTATNTQRIKLKDIATAERMSITLGELTAFQDALARNNVMFISHGLTTTRYSMYPFETAA